MKFLIPALIFFLPLLVNAQNEEFKRLNFQFNLGNTITIPSKLKAQISEGIPGHPKTAYLPNFGYFLEIQSTYNINGLWAIQTGARFNNTVLRITHEIGVSTRSGNRTLSYLQFPLFIKYRLREDYPLYLSVGPYFGLLTRAYENGSFYMDYNKLISIGPQDPLIGGGLIVGNYKENLINNYSSMDYGFSVRVDYEFTISPKLKCVLLSQLNFGLKNVLIDEMEDIDASDKWRNYNKMIGLGIKI